MAGGAPSVEGVPGPGRARPPGDSGSTTVGRSRLESSAGDGVRRFPADRGARNLVGRVTLARADRVDRDGLLDFARTRHQWTLITHRQGGGLQVSPVTGGIDDEGRMVVSTYPDRAKAVNLRRDPTATVLVHSDDWDGPYVQVDGTAAVLDMPSPEAEDALVDYFRCISGEHPDWEEYREAMRAQGKSLVRITVEDWGPVARGGFPPDRVPQ